MKETFTFCFLPTTEKHRLCKSICFIRLKKIIADNEASYGAFSPSPN